jgi:hypothetical protein
MERDSNPFWEHPMVPGARDRNKAGGSDPDPQGSPAEGNPTRDFGVAVSIPKFTAVRREPWRDDEEEQDPPAKPVEPYQHQWSGGWRDFLDAQSEPEREEYRDEFDEMLLPRPEPRARQWRVPRRAVAVACWGGLACLLVGFVLLAFDYASPTSTSHSAPKAVARHTASATVAPSAVATSAVAASPAPQSDGPRSGAVPPPGVSPTSPSSSLLPGPNATPGCVNSAAAGVVIGTGAGGTDSGPDAILWFEHAYYVERSAARARQVVAQYATVAAADHLQHGIDSVPPGTTYCVHITPGPPQTSDTLPSTARRWHVEITEQRPGEQSYIIDQTISTIASDDGTVLITDIVAVE